MMRRLALMVLSLVMIPLAGAKPLATVYEVPLTCQTQQEGERHALFQQGFFQVLGRVSTDPQVASQPQVQAALKNIDDYVEQYTYEGHTLLVRYNSAKLTQLLAQSGATRLRAENPAIVLWLALEQNNDRHLVGAESDPQVHETLKTLAQQQGLPLVLPLMDLEDVSLVTVTDVWGQFTEVLTTASQRYNAHTLLVGRAKREGDQWHSDWTLRHADVPTTWHIEGNSLDALLTSALKKPPINYNNN